MNLKITYIDGTNLAYCNGLPFRKDKKTGYWLNSAKRIRLHRYVWEQCNGEIPKGYHIHHIDGNKDNNDISNLSLLSAAEHEILHSKLLTDSDRQKLRENIITKAQPKAIEWHQSEEGKKWHEKHYADVKDRLHQVVTHECLCCGAVFAGEKKAKFCSNNCKSKYRRMMGNDNISVRCPVCGKIFTTNKYRQSITCSHSCANIYRNLE